MLASRKDCCLRWVWYLAPISIPSTWGSHHQFEASLGYIVDIDGSLRHEKDQSFVSDGGGGFCLPPNTLPTESAMVAHTWGRGPLSPVRCSSPFNQSCSSTPTNILSLYLGMLAERSFFLIKRGGSSLTLRTPHCHGRALRIN